MTAALRETRARHALAARAGRTRHRAAGALPPRRERRPDVIPPVRPGKANSKQGPRRSYTTGWPSSELQGIGWGAEML
jgi:hypothetical protein